MVTWQIFWIARKVCKDIHGLQRMYFINFGNPKTCTNNKVLNLSLCYFCQVVCAFTFVRLLVGSVGL